MSRFEQTLQPNSVSADILRRYAPTEKVVALSRKRTIPPKKAKMTTPIGSHKPILGPSFSRISAIIVFIRRDKVVGVLLNSNAVKTELTQRFASNA